MNPPPSEKEEDYTTVQTTLPILPFSAARAPFETERLVLRPFSQDDLEAYHEMRRQPEVMIWTARGIPDEDLARTQMLLDLHLDPEASKRFNCAIVLKETGKLIGAGGCHIFCNSYGWPELGYLLRKEYWGKGLATEFVRGFVTLYGQLPRREVGLRVHKVTVPPGATAAAELLMALTLSRNIPSRNILTKCGFDMFYESEEQDLHNANAVVVVMHWRLVLEKGDERI